MLRTQNELFKTSIFVTSAVVLSGLNCSRNLP